MKHGFSLPAPASSIAVNRVEKLPRRLFRQRHAVSMTATVKHGA
jgi:hypothetical protein